MTYNPIPATGGIWRLGQDKVVEDEVIRCEAKCVISSQCVQMSPFWGRGQNKRVANLVIQRWANSVLMTEYEYEYYSVSQKWPNTNTNIIRLPKNDRIRIRILFGLLFGFPKIHSGEKSNKCKPCEYAILHAYHSCEHLNTHCGDIFHKY